MKFTTRNSDKEILKSFKSFNFLLIVSLLISTIVLINTKDLKFSILILIIVFLWSYSNINFKDNYYLKEIIIEKEFYEINFYKNGKNVIVKDDPGKFDIIKKNEFSKLGTFFIEIYLDKKLILKQSGNVDWEEMRLNEIVERHNCIKDEN